MGFVDGGVETGGDDEHLHGGAARGLGLETFDLVEQRAGFFEDGGVLGALEDLHREAGAGAEHAGREFQDAPAQRGGSVVVPARVSRGGRGHVAEKHIGAPAEEFGELGGRGLKGVGDDGAGVGREGGGGALKVHARDDARGPDALRRDLRPRARRAAEVEHAVALAEDLVAIVDLDEFVGGARGVAVGLGPLEELVVEDTPRHGALLPGGRRCRGRAGENAGSLAPAMSPGAVISPPIPGATPACDARSRPGVLAIETLASGVLAHPGNGALRSALGDGVLSPAGFLRGVIWIGARLWMRRSAAARGRLDGGETEARPGVPGLSQEALSAAMALFEGAFGDAEDEGGALGAWYEDLLGLAPEVDASGRTLTLGPVKASARRRAGAFYTPPALVEHLLDTALEPVIEARLRGMDKSARGRALLGLAVCDPSCGAGRFLVAAARRIGARLAEGRGLEARRRAVWAAARRCVFGVDRDPIAAELCRFALWLEGDAPLSGMRSLRGRVRVGDALLGAPAEVIAGADDARAVADAWRLSFFEGRKQARSDIPRAPLHWPIAFPQVFARGGFDAVVGNPPFLNQLSSSTASCRGSAALLREVSGGAIGGYTDVSAAFLWLGVRLCGAGGRVAMVQPQSLLSAKDAGGVRASVLERSSPVGLWVSGERMFGGASVFTCAPTLEVGRAGPLVMARSAGPRFERLPGLRVDPDALALEETWGPLAAAALGVPEFGVRASGALGEIAHATADFRDQYYGLAGYVLEESEVAERGAEQRERLFPRVVTSGLIDLASCAWGRDRTRLLKRAWSAPRVDRARMAREGALGGWLEDRLRPKALMATQTRVMEVYVDAPGALLPSVPLVSVYAHDERDLWRVAAALGSPVASAWAMSRYPGAALTSSAIKLSARQALRLPLPADPRAWDDGAALFRTAQEAPAERRLTALRSYGERMCAAYALSSDDADAVLTWWCRRLA